jgi:hypothetical protein
MRLRSDDISWQVVGDDLVVLDLTGSMYLQLNGSGRTLWERLSSPCSAADLASALVDAYGIPADRAQADVDVFVAELRRRSLLTD